MKKSIKVLKQTELCGQQFTVYGSTDEPMFLAKDVASMLTINNVTDMVSRIDEDERDIVSTDTLGGKQDMWFLTEDGLYEVLMQSRKPIAKTFKKGVKDILKSIRKDGGYMVANTESTPEEIIARALVVAQKTIERIDNERKLLQEQNQRLLHTPKTYTTSEIAKELNFKSAQQLNNILKDKNIQYKQNGTWLLYSKYADRDLVSIKQIVLDNGRIQYDRRWTGDGRDFLLKLFKF